MTIKEALEKAEKELRVKEIRGETQKIINAWVGKYIEEGKEASYYNDNYSYSPYIDKVEMPYNEILGRAKVGYVYENDNRWNEWTEEDSNSFCDKLTSIEEKAFCLWIAQFKDVKRREESLVIPMDRNNLCLIFAKKGEEVE